MGYYIWHILHINADDGKGGEVTLDYWDTPLDFELV